MEKLAHDEGPFSNGQWCLRWSDQAKEMQNRSTIIIFSFNHGTLFLHDNQLLKSFSQEQTSYLQKLHETNGSLSHPYQAYLYMKNHWGVDGTESQCSVFKFYIFRKKSKKFGFYCNLGRFELGIHPYHPNQFKFWKRFFILLNFPHSRQNPYLIDLMPFA